MVDQPPNATARTTAPQPPPAAPAAARSRFFQLLAIRSATHARTAVRSLSVPRRSASVRASASAAYSNHGRAAILHKSICRRLSRAMPLPVPVALPLAVISNTAVGMIGTAFATGTAHSAAFRRHCCSASSAPAARALAVASTTFGRSLAHISLRLCSSPARFQTRVRTTVPLQSRHICVPPPATVAAFI